MWSTQSLNRDKYQEYFFGGKGGRCIGLAPLPPSCASSLEIWEPQPRGQGLLYFYLVLSLPVIARGSSRPFIAILTEERLFLSTVCCIIIYLQLAVTLNFMVFLFNFCHCIEMYYIPLLPLFLFIS